MNLEFHSLKMLVTPRVGVGLLLCLFSSPAIAQDRGELKAFPGAV